MSIPPLPKIDGDVDIMFDIFTHKSLQGNHGTNDEYGDTNRLVELGARALQLALTSHFFYKRPVLTADEISEHAQKAISDTTLRDCLSASNIRAKYRGLPDLLDSPEECRRFFHSYIGALYIRNGINHVQAWVSALVDPNANVNSFGTPPPQFGIGMPPPPPLSIPPPLPQHNSTPMQNSGYPIVTLSLMNEKAMTRGVSVTYPAQSTGPSHAPTWTVSCCIQGIEKGRGTGSSQKKAKEEAARQAYQALGW
ncbi:hypothetical protein B0H15DRAFT_812091 [Mycena belliarum]|uniref:DRBM domain-containing protein n=1 Tax=Mycena belliarum TaxID=1033014 RepID=A0AAD6XXQ7_9AGAR|nr:hypothetical protein B0H15DRAFT_812091 [Mycena belliae]